MIAGSFNGTTYSIIALPKFKTLEQLKGAKLAVSSLQAGSTQVLKYILKQKGFIYPRDYNLLRAQAERPSVTPLCKHNRWTQLYWRSR